MLRHIKSMVLCAAVASMASSASQGQECSGCAASPSFGFPAQTRCGSGGCGLGDGHLRDSLHQAQERNALIAARNDAWPKPFACVDRQNYQNLWGQFVDAGYERQCVLSSMHFDSETHELNDFGRTIVSGLIQNMPEARRIVYVHQDGNEDRSQQRLDNVRESIEYMFGHHTPAQVAFSSKLPTRVGARRLETLENLQFESIPNPIIPIASGTTSVTGG